MQYSLLLLQGTLHICEHSIFWFSEKKWFGKIVCLIFADWRWLSLHMWSTKCEIQIDLIWVLIYQFNSLICVNVWQTTIDFLYLPHLSHYINLIFHSYVFHDAYLRTTNWRKITAQIHTFFGGEEIKILVCFFQEISTLFLELSSVLFWPQLM